MLSTARHARDGTTSDDRLRRKARCELETGKRLLELPKLKNEPASVAWSPDGKFLLVGTTQDPSNPERENLLLFDAGSGRLIRAWQGHGATVRAVVFSPDGTRAASCSGRRPDDVRWEVDTSVRIWSVPDGRGLWAQSIGSGGRFAADVAYSPDGHTVLAGGFAGKLVAWDAATGGVRWSTKLTDDVLGVAFSPGGELAAAATGDGRIEAFWADTGRPLAATHSRTLLFGGERSVSFSPDGRVVLAAAGNAVRLWPLLDAVASRPVSGPAEVMAGAVSPDGRLVLTSEHMYQQWGRPKPVTVADAATGLPVATAFGSRVPDGVTDRSQDQHAALAAFLPDGRSILLAEQEGGLGIWDLGLGRRLRALEPWPGRRAAAVAVCSDGRYAVARFWGEDDLQLYDLPTGARLRGLEMEGAKIVDRMAFAPDGSCVAAGSREGLVRAWDPATGRERWSRRFGRVNSIAFSPDGRLLACGGEDALHVLDAGTGRTVAGGPWPQHVWSVGFSPDGRHVLAGGEQHDAVVLWEYATGAVRRASRLPDAWVFDWAFSRDGTRLLISQGETSLLDLDYPSAIRRSEAGVRQARERLAADGNDAEALATLGRWYAARGLPDRAAELFERARGAGANVPQDVLARCYWVTGDAARAAVEYGQAAEAAERAGRADEAAYLRLCLAAVGRSPAERPESLADACVAEAVRLLNGREWAAARSLAERVIRRHPDRLRGFLASADNNQAYVLAEAGSDWDLARQLAEAAVAADPQNPSYLDTLGWVYYKSGRFEEAAASLGKAVSASEVAKALEAVIIDHLGDALWRSGRRDEAMRVWRQAAVQRDVGGAAARAKAKLAAVERSERPAVAPTVAEEREERSLRSGTRPATVPVADR